MNSTVITPDGHTTNLTITVPYGTTNHGVENLLCVPARWNDYIVFFATNFLAHAVTVVSRPGQSFGETAVIVANALFLPGAGLLTAARSLIMHPVLTYSDELRRAARAGALCTLVHPTESSFEKSFRGGLDRIPHQRTVHGHIPSPTKLQLCELPPDTPLKRNSLYQEPQQLQLAYTYSVPKILVGAFQAIWGIITLYKARGNQVDVYGYAAFGLSVTPYVLMSIVNITAALLSPEYPTMYLINSPDMNRDEHDYPDTIAAIDVDVLTSTVVDYYLVHRRRRGFAYFVIAAVGSLAPFAIVGGISRFESGEHSTVTDRGWMMSWLVLGQVSAIWVRIWIYVSSDDKLMVLLFVAPLWVPAIGGMVTVGRMLRDYGVCTKIDF
jgi:hypothetical protein